jgi:hypothetical protein
MRHAYVAARLLLLGTALTSIGCSSMGHAQNPVPKTVQADSYSKVPSEAGSGIATLVGDIDCDGDLDELVGVKVPGANIGRVYGMLTDNGASGKPYIAAEVPMEAGSTMSLQFAHVRGPEGMPDLKITAQYPGKNEARSYYFENKRRGRFSQ